MMWSQTVNAFSFDSLLLSLKISSQNLPVVKPSVAKVIFLSNDDDNKLSLVLEDDDGPSIAVNISDINLLVRLDI